MEELIRQGKQLASSKAKAKKTKVILPTIDPRFELIKKKYDIHALSMRCNTAKCKKKPSKQVLVYETLVKNKKSRDLAILYVCDDHSKNMKRLETELSSMTKGGMVSATVTDRK